MTRDQIAQVQASFKAVLDIKEVAAEMFYERLFELDPALQPLFARTSMSAQGAKLMAALAFVVGSLQRPEAMLGTVRALALRHAGYGVQDSHYVTVGRALLDTLARGLGDLWTPQLWAAWAEAYTMLSGVMIEAANQQRSAAA